MYPVQVGKAFSISLSPYHLRLLDWGAGSARDSCMGVDVHRLREEGHGKRKMKADVLTLERKKNCGEEMCLEEITQLA